MNIVKIETPDEFISQQEDAVEAAYSGGQQKRWPNNNDLRNVLDKWPGMVCWEVPVGGTAIYFKIDKNDFLKEIMRCWGPKEKCNFALGISHKRNMLTINTI